MKRAAESIHWPSLVPMLQRRDGSSRRSSVDGRSQRVLSFPTLERGSARPDAGASGRVTLGWASLLVVSLACTLASAGEPAPGWTVKGQLPLNLEALLDNDAIADVRDRADGNFDCPDHAANVPGSTYPAEVLPATGSVFSFNKVHFLFPSKEQGDFNNVACAGQRLEIPPGRYKALHIIGASENGSFRSGLLLAYKEGPAEAELALTDWCQEPGFGERTAFEADARYTYSSERNRVVREAVKPRLWLQAIQLDPKKTLESVVLPYARRMHIFAATLEAATWEKKQADYANETAETYALLTKRLPVSLATLRTRLDALATQLDQHGAKADVARQAGWLRTQVAYAHDLLGGDRRRPSPGVLRRVNLGIRKIHADMSSLLAGKDPFPEKRGAFLRSYRSPLDGSLQSYSLAVPNDYAGDKPFPLIITLHGHGWYRPFQGHPQRVVEGVLTAAPHGRGSIDYMLAAEGDVLAVLDDVLRDYKVDPRRVYLEGHSMGGTGSWHLGVHYPHRFAALAPVCGNADRRAWDAWKTPRRNVDAIPPRFERLRTHILDAIDPVTYAGNLLNLPAFVGHGTRDETVPVQHSRNMSAAMKKLGCPVSFVELPWVRHWGFPATFYDSRWKWMMERRTPVPERVRHKTASLRHGAAYWVRIDRFVEPLAFAEIDARFLGHNAFEITARNVAAFTLDLDRSPGDPLGAVRVRIGGNEVKAAGPFSTFIRDRDGAWSVAELPRGMAKKAGLEGPVGDVFLSSFLLVRGTTSEDAWEREVIRRQVEARAHDWKRMYNSRPRVMDDTDVTDADIAAHNLVLYGGPAANAITKRVAGKLPVRIEADRIRVGDRTFQGKDVGVKLCYPNPLNPERYVAVFAGLSADAMDQMNNRFGNWFGWGPYDNYEWFDYAVFDARTRSPETFLCVGFFHQDWQLSDLYQFAGDEGLRAARQPHRVPRLHRLPDPAPDTLYLSDLAPSRIDQHKGTVGFGRTFEFNKLTLGQRTFARGLGVRAPSIVEYPLDGKYARFRATVGIDLEGETEVAKARSESEYVQFLVFGDGRRLYSSEWLQWDSRPVSVEVEIDTVKTLRLEVDCSAKRWLVGSADWAHARVSRQ